MRAVAKVVDVAVLLLSDRRHWPRFVAAAMLAEVAADMLLFHFAVAVSLCLAVGNTLEALTGAYLVRRWCAAPFRFAGCATSRD